MIKASGNINEEKIYILKLETQRGTNRTIGTAEIYDHIERGKALVTDHIQKRNLPSRRTQEEGK